MFGLLKEQLDLPRFRLWGLAKVVVELTLAATGSVGAGGRICFGASFQDGTQVLLRSGIHPADRGTIVLAWTMPSR